MKKQNLNILINQIDKKLINIEYRIEGSLCRNKIQNKTYDSNIENLISIQNLLLEIKKAILIQLTDETKRYDINNFVKTFAKFDIFKNKLWTRKI